MNPRQWAQEHPTIAALIVGLAVALLLEGALLRWRAAERRLAARHSVSRLAEMERIADKVRALRGTEGAGGPKYLAPNTRFSAEAVDRVARDQQIVEHVASSGVKEERHADQSREQVVSLSLRGLPASSVVDFLRAVEALDPAVRARKLVITANSDKPSLVDAKVEISAYDASATSTN